MRIFKAVMIAGVLGLMVTPAIAQDKAAQERRAPRCCAHMCPVAQASTKVGYEVVKQAPSFRVKSAELLA